jgi:hypothetical protein
VLFYRPKNFLDHWEQTDLWHYAMAIPGVRVFRDDGGAEAQLIGATTSGEALLYDTNGRLLFHGGITNARGHTGRSLGAEAIRALLINGTALVTETPVFGCPLFGSCSGELGGDAACNK